MHNRTLPIRGSIPRRALGLLALSCAVFGACQTQPLRREQLSESAIVLDIPLVRQDELHECGLASISALCQYWGIQIPAAEKTHLAQLAKEHEGLSGGELCDALERLGLEAFLFEGTLDRSATGLFHQVELGRPTLVMLAPDAYGDRHHYCLVLGYDEPCSRLLLLDPVRGELVTPLATFERDWNRCQRFTLLATPKACEPGDREPSALDATHPTNTSDEKGGIP
jgi:ABC-type bacteriocin/lantibiotic exporter with double-glycine peptidase domain